MLTLSVPYQDSSPVMTTHASPPSVADSATQPPFKRSAIAMLRQSLECEKRGDTDGAVQAFSDLPNLRNNHVSSTTNSS